MMRSGRGITGALPFFVEKVECRLKHDAAAWRAWSREAPEGALRDFERDISEGRHRCPICRSILHRVHCGSVITWTCTRCENAKHR